MFPISDDNPTLRTPWMTYLILAALVLVWFFVQGAGTEPALLQSVCNLGMVPGELTGRAMVGDGVPLGELNGVPVACLVDADPINRFTPLTSMFLHGGWMHLIGNALFFWVFGNNIEDSMGSVRFLVFYLMCGLAAAGAHLLVDPSSVVPTVGASGAISGVMGAYLVLYPRVRVKLLVPIFFFLQIISVPAWLMLVYWFGLQLLSGLPQLSQVRPDASAGVAFWAHIGGFVAGVVLIKLFEDRGRTRERTRLRHRLHPDHP